MSEQDNDALQALDELFYKDTLTGKYNYSFQQWVDVTQKVETIRSALTSQVDIEGLHEDILDNAWQCDVCNDDNLVNNVYIVLNYLREKGLI